MNTAPGITGGCEGCPLAAEGQIKICEDVAQVVVREAMSIDPAFDRGVNQHVTTAAHIVLGRLNLSPAISSAAQTACATARQEICGAEAAA